MIIDRPSLYTCFVKDFRLQNFTLRTNLQPYLHRFLTVRSSPSQKFSAKNLYTNYNPKSPSKKATIFPSSCENTRKKSNLQVRKSFLNNNPIIFRLSLLYLFHLIVLYCSKNIIFVVIFNLKNYLFCSTERKKSERKFITFILTMCVVQFFSI